MKRAGKAEMIKDFGDRGFHLVGGDDFQGSTSMRAVHVGMHAEAVCVGTARLS